jgi:hypothetical protein
MNGDSVTLDVLEYSIIGRRFASRIMLGRQPINGDGNSETPYVPPLQWNWANGAGDDLSVNSTRREQGKEQRQFTETHERFTTHERDVQRLVLIHQAQDSFYQVLTSVVAHLAQ